MADLALLVLIINLKSFFKKTDIFPKLSSQLKLFIFASTEVRAKRRFKELQFRGVEAIYARVLEDMEKRDARDIGRDASPLVAAEDSFQLDTSNLDADETLVAALDYIQNK